MNPPPTEASDPRLDDAALVASWRRQAYFWLLAAAFFMLFLFVFRSILLPFLAGMILAYFLDPIADRLERLGMGRLAASIVILVGFIIALVVALVLVIPVLATQLAEFISRLPDYLSRLQDAITSFDPGWLSETIGVDPSGLRDGLNSLLSESAGFLTTLLQSVWSSGRAIVDVAALFVVTPVVAFYMLLDWDKMVERIDNLIPREHVGTVRSIARDIDASVAGFVRGQGTVCLILALFYATGLTLVGLNFGLLIGIITGLISFIPFVGSMIGLVLSVGVALVQFWPDWPWVVAVIAIFFSGQFIEGNILQPNLVGRSVGLHPVWLMFALFAFGMLFGFVGLLLAVPAAAAVGVLVRFAVSRYMASPLYRGRSLVP
jgi:predicted PurR-regulated permease PerM